ncbi:hypothetical protein LI177_02850 [bacterium 210820-DFI.6.37]|nr:hypothetical protein [bacterium 210820-DFI.6.37]
MKNREKYKDILMDYALAGVVPAIKDGKIVPCQGANCGDCYFGEGENARCCIVRLKWLDEEYIETDWSKVEVDTKIYVGRTLEEVEAEAFPRYFAKYEDCKVYAYAEGCSSWTAESDEDVVAWDYAKLAEDA